MFGKTSHSLERNPDFVMLAKAYGINGMRVHKDEELESAFDQALSHKVPSLWNALWILTKKHCNV